LVAESGLEPFYHVYWLDVARMNTKNVTDKLERKKLKRAKRKAAPAKAKRATDVARGSNKRKVKVMAKGQRKR